MLFGAAVEVHGKLAAGERLEARYMASLESGDAARRPGSSQRLLLQAREGDVKRGSTSQGPHRDDFTLLVNGYDLRLYGSQGQHRTAALALKLAELDVMRESTGEQPILILDDVLSELDAHRARGAHQGRGGHTDVHHLREGGGRDAPGCRWRSMTCRTGR